MHNCMKKRTPEGPASRNDPRKLWYYGIMATIKMTFSLPAPLANQLLVRVPSRERSRFVSDALAARLAERDLQLMLACDAANGDPEVAEIEKEFDALTDKMAEPWN